MWGRIVGRKSTSSAMAAITAGVCAKASRGSTRRTRFTLRPMPQPSEPMASHSSIRSLLTKLCADAARIRNPTASRLPAVTSIAARPSRCSSVNTSLRTGHAAWPFLTARYWSRRFRRPVPARRAGPSSHWRSRNFPTDESKPSSGRWARTTRANFTCWPTGLTPSFKHAEKFSNWCRNRSRHESNRKHRFSLGSTARNLPGGRSRRQARFAEGGLQGLLSRGHGCEPEHGDRRHGVPPKRGAERQRRGAHQGAVQPDLPGERSQVADDPSARRQGRLRLRGGRCLRELWSEQQHASRRAHARVAQPDAERGLRRDESASNQCHVRRRREHKRACDKSFWARRIRRWLWSLQRPPRVARRVAPTDARAHSHRRRALQR